MWVGRARERGRDRQTDRRRERSKIKRLRQNSLFMRVIYKHVCFFTSSLCPKKGLIKKERDRDRETNRDRDSQPARDKQKYRLRHNQQMKGIN